MAEKKNKGLTIKLNFFPVPKGTSARAARLWFTGDVTDLENV